MSTPATQLPVSDSQAPEQSRIERVFELQRETAIRLRSSTAAERVAKIKRLRDAVLAHTEELYAAGEQDFRKPPAEIDATEIMPVVAEANDAIRNTRKWMRNQGVWPTRLMLGTKAWVQPQPKGRTLIISPWNYPVNLTFGPLVSAIAAGNTAILKPSEMTPNLSAVIVKITREVFPEDEVAIFEGDAAVSTALLALPFDHIFFTGGTSNADGEAESVLALKHKVKDVIDQEDKSRPLSDEEIARKLKAKGYDIARRTVTKYRKQLGIPSSRQRRVY